MEEITESLGAFAEGVCESLGAALLIATSVSSLISLFDLGFGESSNIQTAELQRDLQEAEHEKNHALNTIDNCRKSIQASREIITKYRYQQFCPDSIKEIDDGVACFEKLLGANLYDEALSSAQKVAETARNYSDAVLASEKAWADGKSIWKFVHDTVNDKIRQLNSDESRLSLPSGEKIPFRLNEWTDENQIKDIEQAIAAENIPQDGTLEQIQAQGQAIIDRLNEIIMEATEYCVHTYLRSRHSREFIITLKERGWKYKGFRYENNNPKQDMILNFDSIAGDKLKAIFYMNGVLKLTVNVKSNNTDNKRAAANNLVRVLQENGILVNQLDWN